VNNVVIPNTALNFTNVGKGRVLRRAGSTIVQGRCTRYIQYEASAM
jgi:hypothetical protein